MRGRVAPPDLAIEFPRVPQGGVGPVTPLLTAGIGADGLQFLASEEHGDAATAVVGHGVIRPRTGCNEQVEFSPGVIVEAGRGGLPQE